MSLQPLRVVCAALALVASASGGILVVDPNGGGDFTDLRPALSAAAPGDVIHVNGGTYEFVTITKPVTIVGAPTATIRPPTPNTETYQFLQDPAVGLAGPGSGKVVLENLFIGGDVDASWFSHWNPGIAGGGFAELSIHRSTVKGPLPKFPTGIGFGQPGIGTTVPRLLITDSTVEGGRNTSDVCGLTPIWPDGEPGIFAKDATVVLIDTVVRGGDAADGAYCFGMFGPPAPPSPCPCPGYGGEGGVAIIAQTVHVSGGLLAGGAGVDLVNQTATAVLPWGKQPDGAPLDVGALYALPVDLISSGPIRLGASWSLTWLTAGNENLLFLAAGAAPPVDAVPHGWFYLDATAALSMIALPNGTYSLGVSVPASPVLFGVRVGFQVFDPLTGLTRPVFEVIEA